MTSEVRNVENDAIPPYEIEGDIRCGNGCEIVGYVSQTDNEVVWLLDKCPYCGMKVAKKELERVR